MKLFNECLSNMRIDSIIIVHSNFIRCCFGESICLRPTSFACRAAGQTLQCACRATGRGCATSRDVGAIFCMVGGLGHPIFHRPGNRHAFWPPLPFSPHAEGASTHSTLLLMSHVTPAHVIIFQTDSRRERHRLCGLGNLLLTHIINLHDVVCGGACYCTLQYIMGWWPDVICAAAGVLGGGGMWTPEL